MCKKGKHNIGNTARFYHFDLRPSSGEDFQNMLKFNLNTSVEFSFLLFYRISCLEAYLFLPLGSN